LYLAKGMKNKIYLTPTKTLNMRTILKSVIFYMGGHNLIPES